MPTLDALYAAGHQIVGVVTQPDRRRGRGKQLVPSPVKARALELHCPVFTLERIRRDLECQKQLNALDADVSVVVAFGQILPKEILDQPPLGCWNGHGSLLPRWRGAGPIQWSILEGDEETGVGIMAMEEGLDTGPVLLEERLQIGLLENAHQLGERLSQLTADLMLKAMQVIECAGPGLEDDRWSRLKVQRQPEQCTYARMLQKEDFQLNWSDSALATHRKVMALYPGAVTFWNDRRLKVLATEPLIERLADALSNDARSLVGRWSTGAHSPGQILHCSASGLVVSTSGCPILIREAQLESKARSNGQSLIQQLQAVPGDVIGQAPII